MISEPLFYAATIPAVLIFGISKGGFGGGLGILSIPMMALVISPVQAAAILLPILCVMDLFSLWAYRGKWVGSELRVLVPASLLDIGVGTLLFGYLSPAIIRLLLGVIAITFTLQYWFDQKFRPNVERSVYSPSVGIVAAGTRFVIKNIEFPDAQAMTNRMLTTPRYNPWVYLEPTIR